MFSYIRNILSNALLAFLNTPFFAVRLRFVRLTLRPLVFAPFLPPLSAGAGLIAYSYWLGVYTPAPPVPKLFDNILISWSKCAAIILYTTFIHLFSGVSCVSDIVCLHHTPIFRWARFSRFRPRVLPAPIS